MSEAGGRTVILHEDQPVLMAGEELSRARGAVVLLHGRGGTAQSILSLVQYLQQPGIAYLAPEARGHEWYPLRFTAPLEDNQPWLSSALAAVGQVVARVSAAGIPIERLVLAGFSQGACLALEYAARTPRRYGGVLGFSGGLIGPLNTPRDTRSSLGGTPVFLGCSEEDPHIPIEYVKRTAEVMRQLRGDVTERVYPGSGHAINSDELAFGRELISLVASTNSESTATA